jgi:hypothetical protein
MHGTASSGLARRLRRLRLVATFLTAVLLLVGMGTSFSAPAAPKKKPALNPPGAAKPVVTKAFLSNQIVAGGSGILRFTITNPAGNPALVGLSFSDGLPSDLAYGVKTKTCSASLSGLLTVTKLSVAPGPSTCTIDIKFVTKKCGTFVNAAVNTKSKTLDVANLNATLSVVGSPPCPQFKMPQPSDPLPPTSSGPPTSIGPPTSTPANPIVPTTAASNYVANPGGPILISPPASVTKKFTPAAITVGQQSTLTFTITSPALIPSPSGISFFDNLPAGLTYGVPTSNCASINNTPIVLANGQLQVVGATFQSGPPTCTITVIVSATACGTFLNNQSNISNAIGIETSGFNATLTVNDPNGCGTSGGSSSTTSTSTSSTTPTTIPTTPSQSPCIPGVTGCIDGITGAGHGTGGVFCALVRLSASTGIRCAPKNPYSATYTFVPILGINDAESIDAFTLPIAGALQFGLCAQRASGTVRCFKIADSGGSGDIQIVQPTAGPDIETSAGSPLSGIVAIDDTCALRQPGGTVWCWSVTSTNSFATQVAGVSNAVKIAAPCAILANGEGVCWGSGSVLPLVDSANNHLQGLKEITSTCVVQGAGIVLCNSGTFMAPPVAGLGAAKAIAHGNCVTLLNNTISCWGSDVFNTFGFATGGIRIPPVIVPSLTVTPSLGLSMFVEATRLCAIVTPQLFQCAAHPTAVTLLSLP